MKENVLKNQKKDCSSYIEKSVYESIKKGVEYLLSKQQPDGTWRDYMMEFGESVAWITAVVGVTLKSVPYFSDQVDTALKKSAEAVISNSSKHGWSYNSNCPFDADSTAWCLRFLLDMGYNFWSATLRKFLFPYITDHGEIHTYPNHPIYGDWSKIHQDVTPMVGLALYKREYFLAVPICLAVKNSFQSSGNPWTSYWWATDTYAVAKSVELLSLSEDLTEDMAKGIFSWLDSLIPPENHFEAALRLSVINGLPLQYWANVQQYISLLLGLQKINGGWEGCKSLLVPPRFPQEKNSETKVYKDINGLMTTSTSIYALSKWVEINRTRG